ncbi:MAG: ParB/RepB/Spo0J family partition protein [Acidobacteria bacterium]|nr:ParB/RepB/Spo0J family partition protein [Acidobacteriota bacterium]
MKERKGVTKKTRTAKKEAKGGSGSARGRKALGRGLSNLIPSAGSSAGSARIGSPTTVRIDQVETNPLQPRTQFDESSLEELTASIAEHGVIQPVVVTKVGAGRYRLIAGERRLRAAARAGLKEVPVVERPDKGEAENLAVALIENVQREGLNAIDEARAYERLHDQFGLTQEQISARVGKNRSTVANLVRLLKLPVGVQQMVESGELSSGHARALLAIDSASKQQDLARQIVRRGLNVRQTEALVAESGSSPRKATAPEKDVHTRDAEERLTRALQTKVEIDRRRKGGTIKVRFGSEEELIRLFEKLTGQRRNR